MNRIMLRIHSTDLLSTIEAWSPNIAIRYFIRHLPSSARCERLTLRSESRPRPRHLPGLEHGELQAVSSPEALPHRHLESEDVPVGPDGRLVVFGYHDEAKVVSADRRHLPI
jgi:hypothetical protein